MIESAQKFGFGTSRRIDRPTVLQRARSVGIAGDVEAMQLALAAMLGGYQQLLRTIPEGTQARALIDGAFGRSPEVAKKILEAV